MWRVARHDRILPGEPDETALTLRDALISRVKYWREGVERILRSADPGLDHEKRDLRAMQIVCNLILEHMDLERAQTPGNRPRLENGPGSHFPSLSVEGLEGERLRRLCMHDFAGPSLLFSPIPPELYSRVFSIVLHEKEHRLQKKRKMPHHELQIPPNPPGAVSGLAAALFSEGLCREYEGMNPVRVLDPCCRTGTFLLELSGIFHCFRGDGGGMPEHTTDRQDSGPVITLYGVDPDPVMLECTRFVLFLQRYGGSGNDTGDEADFSSLYRRGEELPGVTLVRGNAIIGTDILTDLFRAETGTLQEQRLFPLDWPARFPWVEEAGFEGIGGEFLFPPERLPRAVRDYLARKYRFFRPAAGLEDCYLERILEFLREGGIYSVTFPGRWLSAIVDGDARDMISGKEILTVLEYGPERHGTISHRGEGYCVITGRNAPPAGSVGVIHASTGRLPGPLMTPREEIPAPTGKGGWSLKDPRLGELRAHIANHGTPLSRYLLGEIFRGTLPLGFRREVPHSAPGGGRPDSSRPYARGSSVIPYVRLVPDGYLGPDESCRVPSTSGHPAGLETATDSCRENEEDGELVIATGAHSLMATIADQGMCYDGGILHAPHPDLYLVGVINSSVARFYMIFGEEKTPGSPGSTAVSRAMAFPVHVIDPASAEESRTWERIRMLVERMFHLALLVRGPDKDASERLAVRIGHTAMAIDSLVCGLYGIDPERKKLMDEYLDRYQGR
ncbi:SAM-dependent methyltransferase [Methanolinea mesophila]|uniref:hypothetical protein n=1 Tax=Methanolinea mesophila TaxID=547055 RepID=UPI001AE28F24|nr:hypothetical protein [Methanolinea mesophila]MBP1929367.1 SAM-dependent methyltransferase [Methanolinea mesophila]